MIYAGVVVALGLLLWLGVWMGQRKPAPKSVKRQIVVDGSNVMHWGDGHASIRPLKLVLGDLKRRGFVPVVYFDANVGYKLSQRHMSSSDLARQLPVRARQIVIVPSGEPADPFLITYARRHGCRIVSNDRFRDWRGTFPILREKGTLITGQIRGKSVMLRL